MHVTCFVLTHGIILYLRTGAGSAPLDPQLVPILTGHIPLKNEISACVWMRLLSPIKLYNADCESDETIVIVVCIRSQSDA